MRRSHQVGCGDGAAALVQLQHARSGGAWQTGGQVSSVQRALRQDRV